MPLGKFQNTTRMQKKPGVLGPGGVHKAQQRVMAGSAIPGRLPPCEEEGDDPAVRVALGTPAQTALAVSARPSQMCGLLAHLPGRSLRVLPPRLQLPACVLLSGLGRVCCPALETKRPPRRDAGCCCAVSVLRPSLPLRPDRASTLTKCSMPRPEPLLWRRPCEPLLQHPAGPCLPEPVPVVHTTSQGLRHCRCPADLGLGSIGDLHVPQVPVPPTQRVVQAAGPFCPGARTLACCALNSCGLTSTTEPDPTPGRIYRLALSLLQDETSRDPAAQASTAADPPAAKAGAAGLCRAEVS
ncbi:hypothetical protein H920_06919 [Fukomys damarensis]|uniref:Uncharacterized protein n=1 Tax=Fukomys damarensis TaxID=885580 RepID=A0A091DNA3_FUKDA|nr:hypothetical protein H920_06919 [Fukomys damarensis]